LRVLCPDTQTTVVTDGADLWGRPLIGVTGEESHWWQWCEYYSYHHLFSATRDHQKLPKDTVPNRSTNGYSEENWIANFHPTSHYCFARRQHTHIYTNAS